MQIKIDQNMTSFYNTNTYLYRITKKYITSLLQLWQIYPYTKIVLEKYIIEINIISKYEHLINVPKGNNTSKFKIYRNRGVIIVKTTLRILIVKNF